MKLAKKSVAALHNFNSNWHKICWYGLYIYLITLIPRNITSQLQCIVRVQYRMT